MPNELFYSKSGEEPLNIAHFSLSGKYTFDIQSRRTLANGELIDVYTACDALVIKALALILETILMPFLSLYCYHLKGHGGLKGAVRSVAENMGEYTFVFRTDVKSYYDSIDHHILISKMEVKACDKNLT